MIPRPTTRKPALAFVATTTAMLSLLLLLCCAEGASAGDSRGTAADRSSQHPLVHDMASAHMFKLYDKYMKGGSRFLEQNTIRSFKPAVEFRDKGMIFTFNLTSIPNSEKILAASFHFTADELNPGRGSWCPHNRRSPCLGPRSADLLQFALWGSSSIPGLPRGFSSSPTTSSSSSSSSSPSSSSWSSSHAGSKGWQVRDVTSLVKNARTRGDALLYGEARLARRRDMHNVLFNINNNNINNNSSSGGNGGPWENSPYLLVYANDSEILEPNSVVTTLQRYGRFPLHEERDPAANRAHNASAAAAAAGARRRQRRAVLPPSLLDNELPDDDDHHRDVVSLGLAGEEDNNASEASWSERPRGAAATAAEAAEGGVGSPVAKTSSRRKASRRREGERRRGKATFRKGAAAVVVVGKGRGGAGAQQQQQQAASRMLSFDEQTLRQARRRQMKEPHTCARRALRVDFADIGWSEWIISPKAFDAHYCAGVCRFPMSKAVRPSNHATLQSIVRAVGIVRNVPEPCCVPESMSSLSLLFLDQNYNVVLKLYPNMVAETCACR